MSIDDAFERTLAGAKQGEGWALSELFGAVHPRVLRYLRGLEPGEAEDLASEAWVDLVRALDRFEGDERDLRAMAFTIARRRLADLHRSRARRPAEPVGSAWLEAHGPLGDVEEEALTQLETREALERVAALPKEQAEVVLLRVVGGFSVDEVARLLGRRPGTIRVIQHRALRRLAGSMGQDRVTR